MNDDLQHLRLLSIFHYIVGGLCALFACFPIIHLVIGLSMLRNGFGPKPPGGDFPLQLIGWVFVGMAGLFILGGWTLAICFILAGRRLQQRRRYLFCFVVACVGTFFMPFGTVLGVLTIVTLSRPSVKALFLATPDPIATPPREPTP